MPLSKESVLLTPYSMVMLVGASESIPSIAAAITSMQSPRCLTCAVSARKSARVMVFGTEVSVDMVWAFLWFVCRVWVFVLGESWKEAASTNESYFALGKPPFGVDKAVRCGF